MSSDTVTSYYNHQRCLNKIGNLLNRYKNKDKSKEDQAALVNIWMDSFEECIKESCEIGQYELFGECLDG